jgi:putative DNA primase/helicase
MKHDTKGITTKASDTVAKVIEGGELFQELVTIYERYVKLEEGASVALAAWTLYSHAYDAFRISPILTISSPERRCGKSTLLEIVGHLVPQAVTTSHITPAAIFRLIEAEHPTLIIDEGDAFIKGNEDMRGILNSGHVRHAAYVIRTKPDTYEPTKLSTWCPKVIALIGSLPGTLMDRSIVIPMRRKLVGETVERLRRDQAEELFSPLREACAVWSAGNSARLKEVDPVLPAWLNDRAADNWRPLMAVAEMAGGDWPNLLKETIAHLAKADDDDETIGVQLLVDLDKLFRHSGRDRFPSTTIIAELTRLGHRPWATYNKGFAISERQIAKLLRPFGIAPKTVRFASPHSGVPETAKGYVFEDFDDAFRRYLPKTGEVDDEPPCFFHLQSMLLRCDGKISKRGIGHITG